MHVCMCQYTSVCVGRSRSAWFTRSPRTTRTPWTSILCKHNTVFHLYITTDFKDFFLQEIQSVVLIEIIMYVFALSLMEDPSLTELVVLVTPTKDP